VGHQVADGQTALPVAREADLRGDHGERLLVPRETGDRALAADRAWEIAAVPARQRGLRVEELELGRPAELEEKDHPLGPGRQGGTPFLVGPQLAAQEPGKRRGA